MRLYLLSWVDQFLSITVVNYFFVGGGGGLFSLVLNGYLDTHTIVYGWGKTKLYYYILENSQGLWFWQLYNKVESLINWCLSCPFVYSVMFNPCGAENLCIQNFYFWWQIFKALSLCRGRKMNSRTCILKSSVLLCLVWATCSPKVSPSIWCVWAFSMVPSLWSGFLKALCVFAWCPCKWIKICSFNLFHILYCTYLTSYCIDNVGTFAREVLFVCVCGTLSRYRRLFSYISLGLDSTCICLVFLCTDISYEIRNGPNFRKRSGSPRGNVLLTDVPQPGGD